MRICPNCGEDNPERARFCMSCTSPLTAELPQEVRRTVTIFFSDLQGSTALGEALDPEAVREVMAEYFQRVQGVLERHGGRVEKFIGDAVMAVFGLPRLHEDDALRAIRAALEARDAVHELSDELELRWGVRLVPRTGVYTGEVVAGDPSIDQRLVTGDAVNTAARLEQAAPPGEVLIGKSTYRLVRDAVRVGGIELVTAKGKAEAVPAYRLLEVLPGAAAFARRMDAPIVGREADLDLLLRTLARVRLRGGAEMVTIVGDPGVGKTRLITEFTRRSAGDARVLIGHCRSYGEGTFWPLVEIVREAAGISEDDASDQARAKLRRLLHGEDGSIGDRVAAAIDIAPDVFPMEEIFWGVRKLLEHLARQLPLVIVFDDVHWAEEVLLDLIDHLTSLADAPLLIVCSTRPDLLEVRPQWGGQASRILLEPLPANQADALMTSISGDLSLPAEARSRIRESSGGNPLFIEQILSMLMDEGILARRNGDWVLTQELATITIPSTVSSLLAARLDGLPVEERAVIERASVAGNEFPSVGILELCPTDLRPGLEGTLSALVRRHLIQSVDSNERVFRFRHALIRDAAYAGMLKRLRGELHERFAEWLETNRSDGGPERPELIGYHLEQAYLQLANLGARDGRAIDLGRRAAAYLQDAGGRAFAKGDVGAAANLLQRACSAVPPGEPERLGWLIDLGSALRERGDLTSATRTLDEAIEFARSIHDDRLECRALVERIEVDMKLATPGWPERALGEADQMIPLLERQGDDRGLAKT